jgi:hypothetical protein
MQRIKSFISTIFNGSSQAYIYIWISKTERFIYVGQTNERFGTLGRCLSHIQPNGTLRMRCLERVGLELELINDLHLVSFLLPPTSDFISNNSSFRLAVEYLVQTGLHEAKKDVSPSFQIISNICTTSYVMNSTVIKVAKEIINDFKSVYSEITI